MKVIPVHELGVVIAVVEKVEKLAREQQLIKIEKLVLQIGELSSIVPMYVENCFPAAVDGTLLQDTKLEIEILPGNALCRKCRKVYNFLENNRTCPYCQAQEWEIISGREFYIKEISAC